MQASLDLAEQGYRVYLVETQSAIGGHMAQLDKTFPTNDCAMCTISPKLVETGRHLNIDLKVDSEIDQVVGEAGNFEVTLRHKPRYIQIEKCVSCGDCAEVCPISLADPFNEGLSERKAAFKLYPQAVPNAYAIEKLGTAPCRHACPADQRAQGYIALIAQGRYKEAFRVIKEDNPFPSVCGRTCHHPCEGHCARALVDEAVGIMSLKRFVMDYAMAYGREKVEPVPRTRPEWIAVIGSGPAGLTAAHDLVKIGYAVTVYEALPVAGGMMRVGIPAHRLPKGVLQQDIDDILALGVVLKTDTPIKDPTKLLKEGYDAVCLATGISTRDHSLGVEGEQSEGVLSAATFLRKVNLGEPITVGEKVAVVGGGVTALDAAAVARRLGAEEVFLALDRPRGELPAYHWEMSAVEAEGIQTLEHVTLTKILNENGKVIGVELAKTGKGMWVDDQGRRRPKIQEGTEFSLEVDTVIGTVGQLSDLTFLHSTFDDIAADPKTLASEIPGLFVVGGRKTGASYIVEAIGLGHRVARSIHRYLQNEPLDQPEMDRPPVVKIDRDSLAEDVQSGRISTTPRAEPALLPMQERVVSFREVVLGLTERQARLEAQRCLQCGICSECLACEYACGTDAIDHDMVETTETIRVGSIILAPGYQAYQAAHSAEYGLGRFPNVVTALQLERMLSASGPTQGKILRPSDGKEVRDVAFLQCVGSRDQSHDYCSAVCCMYATKEAIFIKEHIPEANVHVLMMDMRAFSKGYEAYYRRAQEEYNVTYTRCRVSSVQEDPTTHDLHINYAPHPSSEPALHQVDQATIANERFDLVVLSVGMEISEQVKALGRTLGIELDEYGFCHTSFFNPIETSTPGIFAAGPFREPKDIPESLIDASGAAGQAGILLAPSRGMLAQSAEYPEERDVQQEEPRIGVFVCHCGSNIAGYLDVEALSDYAAELPMVVHTDHLLYTCSQDSTELIKERIREFNLNRLVVASCTPITHGPLFKDVMKEAGLNEHLFSMANIRNHCSWVHSDDSEMATEKAMDLVRMAVSRAKTLESLHRSSIPVRQEALVIGGGPAGMNAALTLAQQGFPVHLVERESALGGNLHHLYLNLATDDSNRLLDPQAYLKELIEKVEREDRITTYLDTTLRKTEGVVGDFRSTLLKEDGSINHINHGVTIVATGAREYQGSDYHYGEDERILSQMEFEQTIATLTDPASQHNSHARKIVMIQCVGPAEDFCARTCCATALKNAIHYKELIPDSQVMILYRDLRAYGFKERLYKKALDRGVLFIRYLPDQKPRVEIEADELSIYVRDDASGMELKLDPDLLVLSMPLVPPEGNRALGTILKVPVDMDGWFLEAHVKLKPVEFASDGIFLAGAAHYPKHVDEAIVQAHAAASRAAAILSKETLTAGGAIAHVLTDACVGCLTCVRICPFGVPQISEVETGVGGVAGAAHIEPTICQGCGTCVGECPAYAIELNHYRHEQVESEVFALFESEHGQNPGESEHV
jgi:heterodisulfide reductase subunit A-like polyferredoxin